MQLDINIFWYLINLIKYNNDVFRIILDDVEYDYIVMILKLDKIELFCNKT